MPLRRFPNFKIAHAHYKFPSTHRTGSIFDQRGIIRSYSNGELGKDIVSADGRSVRYRLKSEFIREKFKLNKGSGRKIRVFRKDVEKGDVMDLGLFLVFGFTKTHVKLGKA